MFRRAGVMLAAMGDSADEPILIAIETPRGLLVAALRATAGKVICRRDGVGYIVRTNRHQHRLLPDDTAEARSISVLARADQDAVWRRTKLLQKLRARLRDYYPAS